ncbi:MAG: single-stranded DNA-binding protein [Chitinophagales bacterium]|nr:MAG: single-stranded DNA-binding protein [Chitinophagales bacterium]
MRGVNKVILVGNLGKDPDIQYLDNNVSVARFTLATNDSYKDKDGKRIDQTEWHNIVAWRGLAKIAEDYLKKGSRIYLEGKIRTRSWEDKQTGEKKYTTEIVADNFIMLDKKEDNSNSNVSSANVSPAEEVVEPDDSQGDDLPF